MEIDNQQKIEILLAALQERYNSIHIIRERVQSVSIWILGLLVAASGWLFQSSLNLSWSKKIFLILISIIIWYVLRHFYFADLEKGFKGQRIISAKIEKELGLFTKGFLGEESLYPTEWKSSGQNGCEGKFFNNLYILISVGFWILIGTIIFFA